MQIKPFGATAARHLAQTGRYRTSRRRALLSWVSRHARWQPRLCARGL